MSKTSALHLKIDPSKKYQALVIGRAGMDLYPLPDGTKINSAESFSADLGGSAGNIAVAISRAGAKVALLTALSDDSIGDFVRNKLEQSDVDSSFITTTQGNERTSLALAEVRKADCDVVIYRNNPADLAFTLTDDSRLAIKNASHLVITGTSLIEPSSRSNTVAALKLAKLHGCVTWFDLDYRRFNWADEKETREVYAEAANYCQVIVGNEEEFAILDNDLEALIQRFTSNEQIVLLKRGADGSSLFTGDARLDSGIFPLTPLKPYGAGDAFLGNLLVNYHEHQDWQKAISTGSAAAALVVSQRGCASVMPTPDQIELLFTTQSMKPTAVWR